MRRNSLGEASVRKGAVSVQLFQKPVVVSMEATFAVRLESLEELDLNFQNLLCKTKFKTIFVLTTVSISTIKKETIMICSSFNLIQLQNQANHTQKQNSHRHSSIF